MMLMAHSCVCAYVTQYSTNLCFEFVCALHCFAFIDSIDSIILYCFEPRAFLNTTTATIGELTPQSLQAILYLTN